MSNNRWLFEVAIFAVGAAIGSAVTWKYVKTKYEQIAHEEIESVRDVYRNKQKEKAAESQFMDSYQDMVEQYHRESQEIRRVQKEVKPYVIAPEEFGELDYQMISLTYYADGVLADHLDDPIEDVDSVVGIDSLTHFGEYEDDSVFVRDDESEIDYEILLDARNYNDAVNPKPSVSEDE